MENVRKISKKYYLRQIVACWLACYMFFGIPMVARAVENPAPGALPSYGTLGVDYDVGAGSIGTIVPGLNSLAINSVANGTIIYIKNHDIGASASVTYNQVPTDWALVKVNETLGSTFYGDNAATGIAGSLTATGNFIMSNRRGIVSAPGSYIHGRNLVLSAMRITDADFGQFASGAIDDLKFNTQYGDVGSVTINGNVSGEESVYIAAKNITNAGTISSPGGLVVMAAGDSAVIGRPGSDVVVEVSLGGLTNPANRVVDNGGDGGTGPGTGPGTIEADGGKVILAAGDIYSTAIEGIESLRAEASRDITLNGAIGASGHVEILGGQKGSGFLSSGNADIYINDDITAGSMRIKNGKDVSPGEESYSGIYVADDKNLEATAGDVVVEAVHDVILGGDVTATGDVFINGDEDGYGNPKGDPEGYHPRPQGGGDVIANNITGGGNVEVKGNAIQLNGDVSANGGDLTITGRTSRDSDSEGGLDVEWGNIDVAEGKTLYASDDVVLKDAFGSGGDAPPAGEMDLTGHGSLEIIAAGGSIQTEGPFGDGVKITVENTSPASLTMTQAGPLNLVDYSFGNQNNTDLTLESYNGSVTAVDSSQLLSGKNENAADQWGSITATAYTDITLQGHDASRDITAGALTSNATGFDVGNITVTSDNSKVLLTQDVSANQGSVAVTAIDGGIVSSGDITASDGITLFGEVTADASIDQTFDAGQGTLWAKDTLSTITKTGTGGLTLGGDTLVDLDGIDGSTGDSVWVTDGFLTITDSVDVEGNLKAKGVIHLQGTTNNVAGDILSTGSGITFDHDVDADGVGSQTFDAGTGQLIAENEADIDKSTGGSLTLAGDAGIELGGNVTGTGMESGDKLTFENNVTADGTGDAEDQRFDAGLGALDADDDIRKTTAGNLTLAGDAGIELGGNVGTYDGHLFFEDDVTANGSGAQVFDADGDWKDLIAYDDIIKTTPGDLTLGAGTQPYALIHLEGDVKTTDGHLTFWDEVSAAGSGDQVFDADGAGKDLIADDDIIKTTAGNLTLGAGTQPGAKIELAGDVTTTDGHLIFWDKVIANDSSSDQVFDADGAGKDLIADDDIIKTTAGNLTLGAGTQPDAQIELAGDVKTTDGHLIFWDDVIANGSGSNRNQLFDADMYSDSYENDLVALGNINKTTSGTLTLDGGAGDSKIYVGGDVTTSDGSLIFEDDVIANGTGDQTFTAGPFSGYQVLSRLKVYGSVTKQDGGDTGIDFDGGNLTLESGWKMDIDGDITVEDGTLTAEADQHIYIGGSVMSKGDMLLRADKDGDAAAHYGDPLYGGDVDVEGDLVSTQGSIDVYSTDFTTYLGGDVFAAYDVTLHNNTKLDGCGGQAIEAAQLGYGTLTAEGFVWKVTPGDLYLYGNTEPGTDAISLNNNRDCPLLACLPAASTCLGNLELLAPNGDIQISGDLTTFGLCCGGEPGPRLTQNGGDDGCGWYDRPTGGVSVIAQDGKIYTAADSPDPEAGDYMLNIGIVGNSDDVSHRIRVNGNGENHVEGLGVDLPWLDEGEEGKAAIVILSRDDLVFGPDTQLIAKGTYDSSVVDDRPGVDFLATPGTSIGGVVRDEGDAMDVAIYTGSMGTEEGQGNVHLDGRAIDVEEGGAMVVDAYDTVTFGDFETFNFDTFDFESFEGCVDFGCFMIKLMLRFGQDILEDFTCDDLGEAAIEFFGSIDDAQAFLEALISDPEANKGTLGDFLDFFFGEGYFFNIDRLEVSSRITEWLFQAVSNGTLPFAGDAAGIAAFEDFIGGEYVLRGAGLGNPGITDGRAWVLEDPILPPPLYTEAGERAEEQAFGEGGCPALMNWLAGELGVEEDQIEVTVANAFAYATDIQPCEMCARLKDAATILEDAEGTGVAGLVQVVNEFVATPAPPSEEQMASIATAFADHTDDGTYYATAGAWIDALVEYVGILTFEMGYSAEESTGYANKYIGPVTDTGNASLVAYVQARLAALGG